MSNRDAMLFQRLIEIRDSARDGTLTWSVKGGGLNAGSNAMMDLVLSWAIGTISDGCDPACSICGETLTDYEQGKCDPCRGVPDAD